MWFERNFSNIYFIFFSFGYLSNQLISSQKLWIKVYFVNSPSSLEYMYTYFSLREGIAFHLYWIVLSLGLPSWAHHSFMYLFTYVFFSHARNNTNASSCIPIFFFLHRHNFKIPKTCLDLLFGKGHVVEFV